MKKIVITGGTGRFGTTLKNQNKSQNILSNKKQLNILDLKSIKSYLNKIKPNYLIHLAGLSRPMNVHENNINKCIDLNIIGTANITKACSEKYKINLFFTNYVYPGKKEIIKKMILCYL